MDLISVIIPVYNVEKYLDRCVESVVNQTYKNLEIILIDDGSTDNCLAKCDEWARKDSRIKVIHKKNGGLSDARNAGLKIAQGKYIGFVDSDDWIRCDMYQMLYERLQIDDSDIAACGVEMIWEDGKSSQLLTKMGKCVLNKQEAMRAIVEETWLKQPVWYKLYRTESIQGISFPIGKYHEDVFWSYQAVGKSEKISVFDEPCYFYFQRKESIMGERFSLQRLDGLEAKECRLMYIQEHFPELERLAKCDLLFSCMYVFQMSLRYLSYSDIRISKEKIMEIIKNNRPFQRENRMSFQQSIWLYMAQICFGWVCKLRNKLKIGV